MLLLTFQNRIGTNQWLILLTWGSGIRPSYSSSFLKPCALLLQASMRLLQGPGNDQPIWMHSADGRFSIRSAYDILFYMGNWKMTIMSSLSSWYGSFILRLVWTPLYGNLLTKNSWQMQNVKLGGWGTWAFVLDHLMPIQKLFYISFATVKVS